MRHGFDEINKRMKRAISNHNLISDDTPIMVGLSGGKDSLTLLYALKQFQRISKYKYKLAAGHICLGFPGDDVSLMKNYCDQLEVPFYWQKTRAYLSALGRKQRKLPPPVEAFSGVVHKKLISVPSRAIILLKRLYRRTKLRWNELFAGSTRSESVAMFLAVLELIKNGRINVGDDNTVELNKEAKRKKKKEGDETAAGTV